MSILTILFLSSDELRELTDLKVAKAQMRWLDRNRYPYEVSAAGKPKVLRSLVLDRLQNIAFYPNKTEPNFDAIR
jgi:hypothetical protein